MGIPAQPMSAAQGQAPDERRPGPALNWMIGATVVVVGLSYSIMSLVRGPLLSIDSTRYSQWADLLIASHFNYFSWNANIYWCEAPCWAGYQPPLTYSAWVTMVALAKLVLGSEWANGILVFNLVLTIVVVGFVLRLVQRLTNRRLLVIAAGLAFLAAFEIFLWIPYALSDMSFMALSFVVAYIVCSDAWRTGRTPVLRGILPFALALLALAYRPAGLPIMLLVIVAALSRGRLQAVGSDVRTSVARWTALSLGLLTGLGVVVDAALMSNPGRWPFPILSGWIQELSREYQQGIVIFDRPDTYHQPSTALLAYVWLDIDRLRSFFVFLSPSFSRGHELANMAFFIPVYGGWLVALASMLRSKNSLSWATWWATAMGTLFVVFFAVFNSLQYIDFDWRYRLPCMPVLIMLGAIGWHELIGGVNTIRHASRASNTSSVGLTST